jgi:phosphoribosylformylglycinamidine (FGAM) synthase-like enzyme
MAVSPMQVVKAPGNLVISAYVTCPDITLTVTPDLKLPGTGKLLWVDLGGGCKRLGGSALAHAYGQVLCSVLSPTAPHRSQAGYPENCRVAKCSWEATVGR